MILPLVVIRRLDCVLEPTKDAVLKRAKSLKGKVENVEPVLGSVAGQQFYNTSPLDFRRLLDNPNHIADNLRSYIGGDSPPVTSGWRPKAGSSEDGASEPRMFQWLGWQDKRDV